MSKNQGFLYQSKLGVQYKIKTNLKGIASRDWRELVMGSYDKLKKKSGSHKFFNLKPFHVENDNRICSTCPDSSLQTTLQWRRSSIGGFSSNVQKNYARVSHRAVFSGISSLAERKLT
jgi:hypothetical protein